VAETWTCPACGTRNALDAAECSQCGRWASIFDLERRDEPRPTAEAVRAQAPEPEPVIIAEPHSSTAERERSVFDMLRDATEGGTESEEQSQTGTGRILRWIVIGLAVLWFVLVPLLDQLM
jgi:predicted ATP-dependent serine protease